MLLYQLNTLLVVKTTEISIGDCQLKHFGYEPNTSTKINTSIKYIVVCGGNMHYPTNDEICSR